MTVEVTRVAIAGCGPAGAMLGLLLARAGVTVQVLEKHGDFLRDFRGDTIHPSTAALMDELGLGREFRSLPVRVAGAFRMATDDGAFTVADFTRVGAGRPLGLLPQWDFLDFLTRQASRYPGFSLRMRSTVTGLVTADGVVKGLRWRDEAGAAHELRADVVVGTDGRDSVVRAAAELPVRDLGAPFDVLWFRLPRRDDDPRDVFTRLARAHMMVMIDRGDYWQTGYLIPKGGFAGVREEGLGTLRARVAGLAPFLSDRLGAERPGDDRPAGLTSWDDVRVLSVQLNRLRRWWRPGLLCIGDAAHAMSPVGGVGINLAIQDAVATANLLAVPLRRDRLRTHHLARVQIRRTLPTVLTQAGQQLVQWGLFNRVAAGRGPAGTPRVLRLVDRSPLLQRIPAHVIGQGVLPEHIRSPAVAPEV